MTLRTAIEQGSKPAATDRCEVCRSRLYGAAVAQGRCARCRPHLQAIGLTFVQFTVYCVCYSMKNSKTLTTKGGKPRMVKHWKALAFEKDFLLQVPARYRRLGLGGPKQHLAATITAYYPNQQQDLDVEIVYDLLQKAGIVTNDRYIRRKLAIWRLDASSPRVEVQLEIETL